MRRIPLEVAHVRWAVAAMVVLTVAASSVLFTVREGSVAVVTRLGAPQRTTTVAGLHAKLPWPLERAYVLDVRARVFTSRFVETLTRDKKNIVLQAFVVWSVGDPLIFLQSIGELRPAEERLDALVTNAKNAVLGRYDLAALVSTDPARLKVDEVEGAILHDVEATSRERFGIRVQQVGLNRLGFPPENTRFVLEQMRVERAQYAARHRAEGEREAADIRSQTDLEVARIRAEAKQKAAEIRGRADAEAARIYADAHRRDPDFYKFVRSLDSLKTLLGRRSTVILRTDASPFDLLDSARTPAAGAATPSPARERR
jgi:modulator of FtsH protease HflC